MLDDIDEVLDITAGVQIENYGLIRATERAFRIISEAAKELPANVRDMEPDVPWRNIIGIDATVLDAILWTEFPRLRPAVVPLIERTVAGLHLDAKRSTPGTKHIVSAPRLALVFEIKAVVPGACGGRPRDCLCPVWRSRLCKARP